MSNINPNCFVNVIGRVCRKQRVNGLSIISLAVDRNFTDEDGNRPSMFIDTKYSARSDDDRFSALLDGLAIGTKIQIVGTLVPGKAYTDPKTQEKRYGELSVFINQLNFLESKAQVEARAAAKAEAS